MAKELHKKIFIWLNEQGIENNLKSIHAEITNRKPASVAAGFLCPKRFRTVGISLHYKHTKLPYCKP